MFYIWDVPARHPNRLIGEHDQERSPFYINYRRGEILTTNVPPFIVYFEASREQLRPFDVLPNDTCLPLVSNRVLRLLRELDPEAVQPFAAEVRTADGLLPGYHIINVTKKVPALDWQTSIVTMKTLVDGQTCISDIRRLVLKSEAMRGRHIARNADYIGHVIASQQLRDRFTGECIQGVEFREPDGFT